MNTTHIVAGDSAAGSMLEALRISRSDHALLVFGDDLSCGPIKSGDASDRLQWLKEKCEWPEMAENICSFWTEADALEGHVVVWFGRHSARELAFRHAWAWRINRPYHIVDVTGLTIPVTWGNGKQSVIQSAQAMSTIPPSGLITLLGSERAASSDAETSYRQQWLALMADNAPLRIVTSTGLLSAPEDHFDQLIFSHSSAEWRTVAWVVGNVLGSTCIPYLQCSDGTLIDRIAKLADEGKLFADGDPYEFHKCRIRSVPT